MLTICLSNARHHHLYLHLITLLSQLNNNLLNIDPIKDWAAPTLSQTNTLLKNASSSAPVLDSKAYANHIKSFKTYYTEQELKNNPILTDDRRHDLFITWINNDRQYHPENKKTKDSTMNQPHKPIKKMHLATHLTMLPTTLSKDSKT